MKKQILFVLMFVVSSYVYGQSSEKPNSKVFSTPEIIWCGLDFSQAKCIGSIGFSEPEQVKNRYFTSWNDLVIMEREKFDLQKFYAKNNLVSDLSIVTERNKEPKVAELVIETPYTFKNGQLAEIVRSYKFNNRKDGLGVVYVVESLNKLAQNASIHVVFFDIATNEIYWTKNYTATAKGFGFRNYWAGAILGAMEASKKDFSLAQKNFKKNKS
jgi:hypothetical protein